MRLAIFTAIAGVLSEFAVVAFFHGIEEIGGGVHLAVVLDFFVAFQIDRCAVLEFELVDGLLEVFLFHEHALEGFGVEAEGRAASSCQVCVDRCPYPNLAIKMEFNEEHTFAHPEVVSEFCTGCGLCVFGCPTDPAAITIIPKQQLN